MSKVDALGHSAPVMALWRNASRRNVLSELTFIPTATYVAMRGDFAGHGFEYSYNLCFDFCNDFILEF